jgi:hypothetical protein
MEDGERAGAGGARTEHGAGPGRADGSIRGRRIAASGIRRTLISTRLRHVCCFTASAWHCQHAFA